jgi:hypothetical protein
VDGQVALYAVDCSGIFWPLAFLNPPDDRHREVAGFRQLPDGQAKALPRDSDVLASLASGGQGSMIAIVAIAAGCHGFDPCAIRRTLARARA